MRRFVRETQGDRFGSQVFDKDGKNAHRTNLSMPGNIARINAAMARLMPHLQ
jgi:hypothetical protein